MNGAHTFEAKEVTEDSPARLDLYISSFDTGLMADLQQIYRQQSSVDRCIHITWQPYLDGFQQSRNLEHYDLWARDPFLLSHNSSRGTTDGRRLNMTKGRRMSVATHSSNLPTHLLKISTGSEKQRTVAMVSQYSRSCKECVRASIYFSRVVLILW